MTAPTTVVTATFGGGGATLTGDTVAVEITRGRTGQVFEDIDAGRATIRLNNEHREYDPTYTAGSYYGDLRPGKASPITITSGGLVIFKGMVGDIDISYEVSGRTVATIDAEDDLALLGRQEFDEWTATSSQTAGPRLTAVMARTEVNTLGSHSFDTGVSTLQGDLVTWGSNVLNYIQLVARSDLGYVYVDRTGIVTFKDRRTVLLNDVSALFTDGTGYLLTEAGTQILTEADDPILVEGIPFHSIETSVGSELFYNRVGIDREGGTVQTATNTTNGAADGYRSLTQSGLLLNSDAQSLDMATHLLGRYEEPETRVTSITVRLMDLSSDFQTIVLGLDITDVVTVSWTPNGVGDPMDRLCIVLGVEHSISPAFHEVRLQLGDVSRQTMFILDHPIYGRLDGSNRLGF